MLEKQTPQLLQLHQLFRQNFQFIVTIKKIILLKKCIRTTLIKNSLANQSTKFIISLTFLLFCCSCVFIIVAYHTHGLSDRNVNNFSGTCFLKERVAGISHQQSQKSEPTSGKAFCTQTKSQASSYLSSCSNYLFHSGLKDMSSS